MQGRSQRRSDNTNKEIPKKWTNQRWQEYHCAQIWGLLIVVVFFSLAAPLSGACVRPPGGKQGNWKERLQFHFLRNPIGWPQLDQAGPLPWMSLPHCPFKNTKRVWFSCTLMSFLQKEVQLDLRKPLRYARCVRGPEEWRFLISAKFKFISTVYTWSHPDTYVN